MADLLSVLRDYNLNKEDIIERDDSVIFGELSWPKSTKTNYIMWRYDKNGAPKEYYTLECLLFLLKHVTLPHSTYIRKAVAENIPVLRRTDRKELLAYLNGETDTSESIDKSASVEIPTQVKRAQDESEEKVVKKPKLEDMQVQKEAEGFKINKMRTYHGFCLKSVIEDNQHKEILQIYHPQPIFRAVASLQWSYQYTKRISRTPIIIIPTVSSSLITMYNAQDILQDLKFVTTEEKKRQGAKIRNEILIQRRKDGELTVPYTVIYNPHRLSSHDWERVVAVFAIGHTREEVPLFGMPWNENPEKIFSRICGFHLKYDDTWLDKDVESWDVSVIEVSRTKRHLDRAALMGFWERLDEHMMKNKPHLRF